MYRKFSYIGIILNYFRGQGKYSIHGSSAIKPCFFLLSGLVPRKNIEDWFPTFRPSPCRTPYLDRYAQVGWTGERDHGWLERMLNIYSYIYMVYRIYIWYISIGYIVSIVSEMDLWYIWETCGKKLPQWIMVNLWSTKIRGWTKKKMQVMIVQKKMLVMIPFQKK